MPVKDIFSHLVSVAGAVIQTTGRTKLEDGLWIGGQLKSRNGLHRVRTISLEVQERCENLDPSGGRPNLNLLRRGGLPDFKSKGPGLIPGSPGVRIWPRLGKQDFVCIGREAEFQGFEAKEHPLPPLGGVQ